MCALDDRLDKFVCESTSIELNGRLRGEDLFGGKTSDGTLGLYRKFTLTSSRAAACAASSSLARGRATELRVLHSGEPIKAQVLFQRTSALPIST